REMMPCPICHGTVLNHQKKLQFGDTVIRDLIRQPLDVVIKTVGPLPQLEKLEAIAGGELSLLQDVSLLPREIQVALKML
ncbi:hypothetical protein, partial [Lysinibacillus fusiformis]|uniref:hypothetical protein n=1 Tax=Lysinibacillus fusiformis TaxID=28031 RepID=UPI003B971C21